MDDAAIEYNPQSHAVIRERNQKGNWGTSFFFWFIWPFGALLYAIRNFHVKENRIIIILFSIFFGFTFIPRNEGMDAYRHIEWFQDAAKQPWSYLSDAVTKFFALDIGYLDIYIHIVYSLLGVFTNNGQWLLAFSGFALSYFYVKTIGDVYDEFGRLHVNRIAIFFLVFAALYISINNISFMRFWTAAWVFLYFFNKGIRKNEKKYGYWSALSVFIHFSFALPVILFLLHLHILKYRLIFFVFILAGLFFSGNFVSILFQSSAKVSQGVEYKIYQYTDEQIQEVRAAQVIKKGGVNWYVSLRKTVAQNFIYIVFLAVFLSKKFYKDKVQTRLSQFIILFYTVISIITLSMSVIGIGRFNKVLFVMVCFYLFRNFAINRHYQPKWILWVGVPVLLFYAAVEYRGSSEYSNILALVANPLIALFSDTQISLKDVFL